MTLGGVCWWARSPGNGSTVGNDSNSTATNILCLTQVLSKRCGLFGVCRTHTHTHTLLKGAGQQMLVIKPAQVTKLGENLYFKNNISAPIICLVTGSN